MKEKGLPIQDYVPLSLPIQDPFTETRPPLSRRKIERRVRKRSKGGEKGDFRHSHTVEGRRNPPVGRTTLLGARERATDAEQSSNNDRFAEQRLPVRRCGPGLGFSLTQCMPRSPSLTVSAEILVNSDIPWVILGHSERRQLLNESSEFVGDKVAYALSLSLKVIACIEETLEQCEAGTTMAVVAEEMVQWSLS